MKYLLLLLLLGCSGCVHTADIVRALATDTNQVEVSISTPYGTVHYERNVHRMP